jgi:hypothetical protein
MQRNIKFRIFTIEEGGKSEGAGEEMPKLLVHATRCHKKLRGTARSRAKTSNFGHRLWAQ